MNRTFVHFLSRVANKTLGGWRRKVGAGRRGEYFKVRQREGGDER